MIIAHFIVALFISLSISHWFSSPLFRVLNVAFSGLVLFSWWYFLYSCCFFFVITVFLSSNYFCLGNFSSSVWLYLPSTIAAFILTLSPTLNTEGWITSIRAHFLVHESTEKSVLSCKLCAFYSQRFQGWNGGGYNKTAQNLSSVPC